MKVSRKTFFALMTGRMFADLEDLHKAYCHILGYDFEFHFAPMGMNSEKVKKLCHKQNHEYRKYSDSLDRWIIRRLKAGSTNDELMKVVDVKITMICFENRLPEEFEI